jgi:hypothetical protein
VKRVLPRPEPGVTFCSRDDKALANSPTARSHAVSPPHQNVTTRFRGPQAGTSPHQAWYPTPKGPDARRAKRSDRSIPGGYVRIRTAEARSRRRRDGRYSTVTDLARFLG